MKNVFLRKLVFISIVIIALVAIFGRLSGILASASSFWSTIDIILENPRATYTEKMTLQYPRFYPFMQWIKENTPEHSTIYLPPDPGITYGEPMWPIAHIQVVSALLYPRQVVGHTQGVIPHKYSNSPTYVIKFNGYPDQPLITGKETTMFNEWEGLIKL